MTSQYDIRGVAWQLDRETFNHIVKDSKSKKCHEHKKSKCIWLEHEIVSHFTREGSGLPTDGKICWSAGEGRSLLCWQVLVLMNLMIHWWFTDDSLMIHWWFTDDHGGCYWMLCWRMQWFQVVSHLYGLCAGHHFFLPWRLPESASFRCLEESNIWEGHVLSFQIICDFRAKLWHTCCKVFVSGYP